MDEKTSFLTAIGGYRGIAAMVILLLLVFGYRFWEDRGSRDALASVAATLGLQASDARMSGVLDGSPVTVRLLTERTGGTDYRRYTQFEIVGSGAPARIVANRWHGTLSGADTDATPVTSGIPAFDEAVHVASVGGQRNAAPFDSASLAQLDEHTRAALIAATEAGWSLERHRWQARETGHVTSPEVLRNQLALGLAAQRAWDASKPLFDAHRAAVQTRQDSARADVRAQQRAQQVETLEAQNAQRLRDFAARQADETERLTAESRARSDALRARIEAAQAERDAQRDARLATPPPPPRPE